MQLTSCLSRCLDRYAIPSPLTSCSPYHSAELSALVDGAFPGGQRSFSNVLVFKADVQFALDLNAKAHELFEPFVDRDTFWATTFQPFGKAVTRAIASKPSFQGLETMTDSHLIVFGVGAYWDDASLDEPLDQWSRDLLAWGAEESQRRGLGAPWLYLNYALPWQPVYESFGAANHQKMKDLKAQYDPENVFGRLWPGGYKL
ncbi:hypothetical protein MPER_06334 [Moniliophthora perniciosa FA553]|nr:hypothetical protein MPER_06334 [Moniliophthora perniciosa FA553]